MVYSINDIKTLILDILKRNNVKRVALFGSVVRGEALDQSDVDILIEFEGRKSLLDLAGLKLELQEILNCNVDVLTYNSIHPLLKDKILNGQVVIL